MNKSYLLIGGNQGNRHANLLKAHELINAGLGSLGAVSSIYETAAWGNTRQPAFLNQALELNCEMDAPSLMESLLHLEERMGRVRTEKYGPRIIDIDILLFNDQIIDSPLLSVPHPELPNRRFALEPLAEIAPDLRHPLLHKTIRQLLEACSDPLEVTRLEKGK